MSDHGRKDALLGMPHGTACNKLRKALLFMYVTAAGHDYCFRCSKRIERVEHLSIEHKAPWLSSANPRIAFFDLDNIAFSHLSCNAGSANQESHYNRLKTNCPHGHPYDEGNTRVDPSGRHRRCRTCKRAEDSRRDRSVPGL